jgi:glycosyltransferase involved in cell wall biosynthesis
MGAVSGHIVVNGRFLQRPVTGVERFATEMLRALDQLISAGELPPDQFSLVVPVGTKPKVQFQHIPFQEVGRHQGHIWEQIDLPLFCKGKFLLSLCNTAPAFKRNQSVVIHDAAVFSVPQAYGLTFKLVYRVMHNLLARKARQILTVSEFSRQELLRVLPIRNKPVKVVREGAEHVLRGQVDDGIQQRAGLKARPYVLAVSSAQANKNFGFVAQTLAAQGDPGFDLVVAGGTNPNIFASGGAPMPPFIKHVGYVSDAELSSLYRHAACFVFPSLYEGFGIPPLEAMAHGCPVVASTAASIPEVCGDAAVYFDPRDGQSFMKALTSVMNDPQLQVRLKSQALAKSREWTWTSAARTLLSALPMHAVSSHE